MALPPANDQEKWTDYTVETKEASPAHLLTKIEPFSMLWKHEIRKLESSEFEAGDYKWKVTINLDGGEHISVYLSMVGTSSLPAGWEVNAIFNLYLYNHVSNNYRCFRGKARRFHAIDSKWGFSKLISKESMLNPCNGYILEDKCVYGTEVFVIKKQPTIENVCLLDLSNPYNYKQEWKISKTSKLKRFSKPEELCVGGYKWNIKMYPNGDSRRWGRYVSNILNWIHSKSSGGGGSGKKESTEYSLETRDTSPRHLLTTIESFSLLLKHQIRIFQSTEFEAGDHKWKMRINLDGDDHFSVYLSMVGTSSLPIGWEVNAIFNFFIYNHISDNYLCFRGRTWRFHAIKSEWEFSKLMTKKSLTNPCNGYLFEDKCVFGAEVFVIKKQQPLIEKVSVLPLSDPYKREWKISEFSKLRSIWKSEEFSHREYKWELRIYPNGYRTACGRYVSIFLMCVDARNFGGGKKVNVCCLFCLRNKLNHQKTHSWKANVWYTSSSDSWGFDEFKAIGDMLDPSKGFVVDDCCILEIQLYVQALQEEALPLNII